MRGTLVRITEKIHGTNCRVGLLKLNDEWQFVAGSHTTARKQFDQKGRLSLYWRPLQDESVLYLLTDLCGEADNVIVFGEMFGPGVQDLDYGVPAGEVGFRVFDISINGHYLDGDLVEFFCFMHNVPYVPELFCGPFTQEVLDQCTYGPSTLPGKSKFTGREGCVVTPLHESYSTALGRVILKSKSADFIDRKGARDDA
jgi:RNA ligase (TIGR02306 family)